MTQIALVTGGTRGLGAAIAVALKDAGYLVVASYLSDSDSVNEFHKRTAIEVVKFDVRAFDQCEQAIQNIEAKFGPIDVLVNNAGITRDSMLHKMTYEDWNAVTETNLDALFNTTRCVINGMRERSYGRVINISSVNGQKGQMGQANYSAAKAGVIGFTKALAQENARKGITVNCIAPGYIGTEMVMAIPEDVLKSQIIPTIPVGRLGKPEEVARCVTFLASPDSGFITGSTLSVNGGQHMV